MLAQCPPWEAGEFKCLCPDTGMMPQINWGREGVDSVEDLNFWRQKFPPKKFKSRRVINQDEVPINAYKREKEADRH